MNIYVGNLDYKTSENEIERLFEEFGPVSSVKIINDKFSGRSKGFGFVTMDNDDEARNAIQNLNGKEFRSRKLTVNESKPQKSY